MDSLVRARHRRRFLKICFVVATFGMAGAIAAVSWADIVAPDADFVTAGNQASRNLGTVAPGAMLTPQVSFELQCGGNQHVDNLGNVSLTYTAAGSTIPAGGSMSAANPSIGPIPATWPDDGNTCGSPAPTPIQDNGNSNVTITAPTTSGTYNFVPKWNVGAPEASDVTGAGPSVTFTLTVAAPDTTGPTINCTVPNQTTWYGSNVTVNCTASDGGSGLANPSDASFSLTTNVGAGAENANAATDSHQVCDNATNCATGGPYTFKVDLKAPLVSCAAPDGLWHAADVSLACTASDGGSGVSPSSDASFSLSTTVASGSEDGNASTGSKTVSDAVGNTSTAGPITGNKVDRKAPQLSGCESPDGSWHSDNVTLHCTYTDGGSGPGSQPVSLTTSVAVGDEDNNASASAGGTQACDGVGNCAPSPGDVAGNKVDRKAPQFSGCESADGLWHALNVTLHCTYTDGGSGPGSQQVALQTHVTGGNETDNASASASGQACDAASNCAPAPADIPGNKVDRNAPQVSCGSADGNWHASDVSIGCTATDGGSGLGNPADASFDLQTNVAAGTEDGNASTSSRDVADAVGNSATAGPVSGNKVDKKAPQQTGCDSPDTDWHATDVTLHCTYADGGSGPVSQQVALQTNVPDGMETDNASASAGGDQACDTVGNCADSPLDITGNKIDKKAPEFSCGAADGLWHGDDVSIACSASDGGSGVAVGDASFALTTDVPAGSEDDNASTDSKVVHDAVGNSATAGPIAGNKVDKKAPTVSCGAADGLWYAGNVSIPCTASDGGSGVEPASDGSFSLSTTVPAGTEDGNASTGSKGVSDRVGNSSTAGPIAGNKIDRKAPELSGCGSPDGSWHADNVTLHCTYTDGGSGPGSQQVALQTHVTSGNETDNAAASASGQACDAVSNCAPAPSDIAGNKVDRKAPQVSCDSADGNWHAADVSIGCAASDGGSGVNPAADGSFSLVTNVAAGTETSNASTNSKVVSDAVGNSATAGPIAGNKVDRKAPSISCDTPASVFLLNQSAANVTGVVTDGGSGPASQSASAAADTSSVLGNPKSVTLNAADNVGNASSKSCSYSVVYDFDGFFAPVNSPGHINGVFNSMKAGQAVPLKFSLRGNRGLGIIASGYPKWIAINCSTADALDPISDGETVTAGQSSLSYDATAGQYVYVWKTDKTWAGTCKRVQLKLVDNETYTADFKFTK